MKWIEILTKLRQLDISPEDYIVVGGAALSARNIRETFDIDLVVSPSLFEQLAKTGWKQKLRPNGKPGLHCGCIEAYLDVHCGGFEPSFSCLLEQAESIEYAKVFGWSLIILGMLMSGVCYLYSANVITIYGNVGALIVVAISQIVVAAFFGAQYRK